MPPFFPQTLLQPWNIDPLGVASRSTRESKLRKSKKNVLFPFRSECAYAKRLPLLSSKANKWSYGVSCVSLSSFLSFFFFNPTCIEKKKGNETILISMFVFWKLNFYLRRNKKNFFFNFLDNINCDEYRDIWALNVVLNTAKLL